MKVLVIGSGGREHALVWKINQSLFVDKIYAIPGNAGIAQIAECADLDIKDFPKIADFVKSNGIDLTVVGPEIPLVDGIVDYFNNQNLKIFGPDKQVARLEGSKVFAKNLMKKYQIPTAEFEVFDNSNKAREHITQLTTRDENKNFPLVVKADGLAAGKGVIICKTPDEAIKAINSIMDEKIFQEAGNQIIIEDFLKGEEASILAFCDGKTIAPMIPSQDHKQVFDGDKGPNTGGIGAYAPAPVVTEEIFNKVTSGILEPLKDGLEKENIKYKGIIYVGIIIVNNEPFVLEFNVRFGDPETQAVLPLLETDLIPVMEAVINENLQNISLKWYNKYSVCVVLVSGGYPGKYEKDKLIYGLDTAVQTEDVIIFHAGTKFKTSVANSIVPIHKMDKYLSSGGRVLGVTGLGDTLKEAIKKTYEALDTITFEKMHYRRDIGAKGLKIRIP